MKLSRFREILKEELYLYNESFQLNDIPEEKQSHLYDLYKKSYENIVGKSWDINNFMEHAELWDFFGNDDGYVTVREQNSGLYKLAVVGGNPRSILKGFQELQSTGKPIWGMVSKDILNIVKKLGFKSPNSILMNGLLRLVPREVFGGVDFKINIDGSITLHYGDIGDAVKYFVGNDEYFEWLKKQIKNKTKLPNLIKNPINEGKQIGNLYHFTPLSNIHNILKYRFLFPNDENQISTSIRANMDLTNLTKTSSTNIARLTLDGDKISHKYKIRPFSYEEEDLGEEQIVVDGKNFYFLPYLKRIDIFQVNNKTINNSILNILDKANIPYQIYKGTPLNNIPYRQDKTGDPTKITSDKIPFKQIFTREELLTPGMKPAYIEYFTSNNINSFINQDLTRIYSHKNLHEVFISPKYPEYYIEPVWKIATMEYILPIYNSSREKINVKIIPIPEYNDTQWRNKWKQTKRPVNISDFEKWVPDSYMLIPKNKIK